MFFDPATVEAVRDLAPAWLVVVFAVLSFLGSTYYQVPMLLVFYLLEARDRVATWLAIVAGSYSFRSLLKNLNDIDRPPVDSPLDPASFPALVRPIYEHPAEIATTSFPSGHVIAATVLWGLLVVDADVGTRRDRLAVAGLVITIVAASRVVLAAHYVEDVVAGLLFGGVFLGGALLIRERSAQPVVATFALSGLVSFTVVSFTASTTASGVLGFSIGVLTVIYGRRLARRSRPARRPYAVAGSGAVMTAVVVLLVVSQADLSLTATGVAVGAVVYWLPEQPIVRSTASASRARLRAIVSGGN